MAKNPKKPTGQLGYVSASLAGAEFIPIQFPQSKVDIEQYVVNAFLRSAGQSGILFFDITGVHQNAIDDLDYRLDTNRGPKYLELMEIAPLEHLRGQHSSAPSSYNQYDFAQYIHKKAMGKSCKYTNSTAVPIMLLMYVTHWAFGVGPTTLALLQFWALQENHCFEWIYFYSPIDQTEGTATIIYPSPRDHWRGFDPETYRNHQAYLFSPQKWIHVAESVNMHEEVTPAEDG
jgi:hypothetical protein